jgi:hypothetical protein
MLTGCLMSISCILLFLSIPECRRSDLIKACVPFGLLARILLFAWPREAAFLPGPVPSVLHLHHATHMVLRLYFSLEKDWGDSSGQLLLARCSVWIVHPESRGTSSVDMSWNWCCAGRNGQGRVPGASAWEPTSMPPTFFWSPVWGEKARCWYFHLQGHLVQHVRPCHIHHVLCWACICSAFSSSPCMPELQVLCTGRAPAIPSLCPYWCSIICDFHNCYNGNVARCVGPLFLMQLLNIWTCVKLLSLEDNLYGQVEEIYLLMKS